MKAIMNRLGLWYILVLLGFLALSRIEFFPSLFSESELSGMEQALCDLLLKEGRRFWALLAAAFVNMVLIFPNQQDAYYSRVFLLWFHSIWMIVFSYKAMFVRAVFWANSVPLSWKSWDGFHDDALVQYGHWMILLILLLCLMVWVRQSNLK